MGQCGSKFPFGRSGQEYRRDRDRRSSDGSQDLPHLFMGEDIGIDPEETLKECQENNLVLMRQDIKTDLNMFILNQLLLSIQFFKNFEKDMDASKFFKHDKEQEYNKNLTSISKEGAILGERRVFLLHGLPRLLADNFIYQPKKTVDDIDALYKSKTDVKKSFLSNSILPLDFHLTWDNLELYEEKGWEELKNTDYSLTQGAIPIYRFCMEESSDSNSVPKGYVRLLAVDIPIEQKKPPRISLLYQEGKGYLHDYDYATVSEVKSERSEGFESESDSLESDDTTTNFETGESFLESLKNQMEKSTKPNFKEMPVKSPPTPPPKSVDTEEVIKNWQKKNKEFLSENEEGRIPEVTFDIPILPENSELPIEYDPDNMTSLSSMKRKLSGALPKSFLNYKPSSNLFIKRKNENKIETPPLLSLGGRRKLRKSNSSGYDSSLTQPSSNNSIHSEEVHNKWRQVELKKLWQYTKRNRKRNDKGRPQVLSPNCFMQVKFEENSDEEIVSEVSDSDSDDSETRNEKRRPAHETKYEVRSYLDSSEFSSEACSEFTEVGARLNLSQGTLNQSTVYGTSIRCEVTERSNDKVGDYEMLYTFTPGLQSKTWPSRSLLRWNYRMGTKSFGDNQHVAWPMKLQLDSISELGCMSIPLGYRSIEVFNRFQSLEWQVNFPHAENNLLNSLYNVHWKTYIIAGILFRAFIAPLGPLGIGLDHIRNILYFMCEEDFVGWEEERSGFHLKALLGKIYETLGKQDMPSFFILNRNILKSIPPDNARRVQAHLNKIKDNLIVYCIYAFRNLSKQNENFYPSPDLLELYTILTKPNQELVILASNNPNLDDRFKKQEKQTRTGETKGNRPLRRTASRNGYAQQVEKRDKVQNRYRKKWERYEREKKRQQREKKRLEEEAAKEADAIPKEERRRSIDLDARLARQIHFSEIRLGLTLKFFIKHFLAMAEKAVEFSSYGIAFMYVIQVENLCTLANEFRVDWQIGKQEFDGYSDKSAKLRIEIGNNNVEYMRSKLRNLDIPNKEMFGTPDWENSKAPTTGNNWQLDTRKLPSLPSTPSQPQKQFGGESMVKSLLSFSNLTSDTFEEKDEGKSSPRRESIKFINANFFLQPTSKLPRVRSIAPPTDLTFEEDEESEIIPFDDFNTPIEPTVEEPSFLKIFGEPTNDSDNFQLQPSEIPLYGKPSPKGSTKSSKNEEQELNDIFSDIDATFEEQESSNFIFKKRDSLISIDQDIFQMDENYSFESHKIEPIPESPDFIGEIDSLSITRHDDTISDTNATQYEASLNDSIITNENDNKDVDVESESTDL